jgi:hypothetical protein
VTTETKRLTIDDIVPVPKEFQDVTAATLATYYTAFAQLHFRLMLEHPDQDKRQQSTVNFCNYYMIAGLLRDLAEHGDEQGDAVARDMWENIARGYGHVSGPEVWSWLEVDGIDPEGVNVIAEEMIDEHKAQAKPIVLPRPDEPGALEAGPFENLGIDDAGRIVAETPEGPIRWTTPDAARTVAAHLAALADLAEKSSLPVAAAHEAQHCDGACRCAAKGAAR